ncbi:hypothetical protein Tco_1527396 [Tanacetum coccineum]
MVVPNIVVNTPDHLVWQNPLGVVKPFSVAQVWSSLRPRNPKVPWYVVVWFFNCIPRHAFNLWLIIKQRLKTQDKVCSRDVSSSLASLCPLCDLQPDSHEHLFFECQFSQQVWSHFKPLAGLSSTRPEITHIISTITPFANRRSSKNVIAKLVMAALAYFVWQKRNNLLFKNNKRTVTQLIACIMSYVRLKLLSCYFKRSREGVRLAHEWSLPDTCFC